MTIPVLSAALLSLIFFSGPSSEITTNSCSNVAKFKSLFNGKDFSGWYTYLAEQGKNSDPDQVFSITPAGELHISGKEFGYIGTVAEVEDFHLRLKFKWGEKRYPPRENAKRDSGILYHFSSAVADNVWPKSIECQIQEGDCGDFWLVDGTTIDCDGEKEDHPEWNLTRYFKSSDNENPTGAWNTVEVISKDGLCQHLVNGQLVNEGSNASVRQGKILLQSEGAEIYYKDIELKIL